MNIDTLNTIVVSLFDCLNLPMREYRPSFVAELQSAYSRVTNGARRFKMTCSVTNYNDRHRQIWNEELKPFVPQYVFDAQTIY